MPDNGRPIPDSYWVVPEKLLAGRRPSPTPDEAKAFLDAGITEFIDLTFDGEFGVRSYVEPYAAEAERRGSPFQHRRYAIVDRSIPEVAEMKEILSELERAIAAGERVYLHCFGGLGRTGTVVGCKLVSEGMSANDALKHIVQLRQGIPSAKYSSPETPEQHDFVRAWPDQEPSGDEG